MKNFLYTKKSALFRKVVSSAVAAIFVLGTILLPSAPIQAQYVSTLPKAGEMVLLSPKFEPVLMQGLTLNPNNPLQFDFLVDRGEMQLPEKEFKQESEKLIKYFLSAVTIPDNDSWVNLSPYESDRIIPDLLASTEMGKQMLEQDYLLKQLSASLTNPEKALGKKFWDTVHKRALEKFGTSELPMNTFNKVWIVPEKAVVVEQDGYAFITESRLKVMIAEDYDALQKSLGQKASKSDEVADPKKAQTSAIAALSSQVVKEIIIPELEKEVNEGKNFAPVRQIYSTVILASWYKKTLKDSLLGKVYMDKGKIKGVDIPEKDVKQKVYDQYVDAFKRGVYNLIQEDEDSVSGEVLPRKYFSGGLELARGSSVILDIVEMGLQNLSQEQQDAIQKYVRGFLTLPGEPSTTEINSIHKAIIRIASLNENNNGHSELALALAIQLVKDEENRLRTLTVLAGEGAKEITIKENTADQNTPRPHPIQIIAVKNLDARYKESLSTQNPMPEEKLYQAVENIFTSYKGSAFTRELAALIAKEDYTPEKLIELYAEKEILEQYAPNELTQVFYSGLTTGKVAVLNTNGTVQTMPLPIDLKPYESVLNAAFANNPDALWQWLNTIDTVSRKIGDSQATAAYLEIMASAWLTETDPRRQLLMLLMRAVDPQNYNETTERLSDSRPEDNQYTFNSALSNFLLDNPTQLAYAGKILNIQNEPSPTVLHAREFNAGDKYVALYTPNQTVYGTTTESTGIIFIFPEGSGVPRSYQIVGNIDTLLASFNSTQGLNAYLARILIEQNPAYVLPGGIINLDTSIALRDAQQMRMTMADGRLNPDITRFLERMRKTPMTEAQENADRAFIANPTAETLLTLLIIRLANPVIAGEFLRTFPHQNTDPNVRIINTDTYEIISMYNPETGKTSFIIKPTLIYTTQGIKETPITLKGNLLDLLKDSNLSNEDIENLFKNIGSRSDLPEDYKEGLFHIGIALMKLKQSQFEINSLRQLPELTESLLKLLPNNTQQQAREMLTDIQNVLQISSEIRRERFLGMILATVEKEQIEKLADLLKINLREYLDTNIRYTINNRGVKTTYDGQAETTIVAIPRGDGVEPFTASLPGNWQNFPELDSTLSFADMISFIRMVAQYPGISAITRKTLFRILTEISLGGINEINMQNTAALLGVPTQGSPKTVKENLILAVNNAAKKGQLKIILGVANHLGIQTASAAIILTNPLNNAIVKIEIGDDGNATAIFQETRLIVPTDLLKILEGNPRLMTAQEFSELATIAKESIQSTEEQLDPRKIGLALTLLVDISIREKKRQDAATSGLELTSTYYRQSESENDKNVIENLTKSLPPKIAGYIEQLFKVIGMPDYSPTTKKDRSEAIKQVITQIFKENIANEIVWALGINTVSDAKPDGKITTRYNFLTDESIIAITPKRTFGDGQTYFYSFQGDWTAPEYRALEADTQRAVAHMEKLFKIISDLALQIPQGQDQIAFQVLDALSTMSPLDFSPEQWGKSNSEISKIGQVFFTDSRLSYISQNIGQFVVANKNGLDTFARTEKLVSLVVEAIKKNPAVLQDLAGILIAPRQETKATVASSANTNKEVGGIDFNPNLLNLQIKRNDKGVPLPLPMQDIDQINIEGLYPVIINIAPARIENMPFLTGAKPKPETDKLSLAK